MTQKRFTAESCHEIGYGWEIFTPETLTEEEVEGVIDMLINYTDEPNNGALREMLSDKYACDSLTDYNLNPEKLEEYKKIEIEVTCVNRDAFSQSIQQEEIEEE